MCPTRLGYSGLEWELRSGSHEALLLGLKKRHPSFDRFDSWADVVAFSRRARLRDPIMDEVLRPIFQSYASDRDPRWRTVLLAMFWRDLRSIWIRKRGWDRDGEELQQRILCEFLNAVDRLDLTRRREQIGKKLLNDTAHHLHDSYCREWRHKQREIGVDPDVLEDLAGVADGDEEEFLCLRDQHDRVLRRLRELVDEGRISDADVYLLVGTRAYGRSVADYAKLAGISYECAKKRRQRLEALIRNLADRKRWPDASASRRPGDSPL